MRGRLPPTLSLWILGLLALGLLVVRGGPWLWPRLFPGPGEGRPLERAEAPAPELVSEVVGRVLASWGGVTAEGRTLVLPRGRSPEALEEALRADPRLEGLEVYATRRDELVAVLRVYAGAELLLEQELRPWLPEHPVPPPEPPPLALVVLLGVDDAPVRPLGAWKAPLAFAIPPAAAYAVGAARQASWDGKGVLVLLDPAGDLVDQSRAWPEAAGVVLPDELGEDVDAGPWLAELAARDLVLVDARPGGSPALRKAAAGAGVRVLRATSTLGEPGAESLAWNLALRRGGGLVLARPEAREALEAFVEASRADGYPLVLPHELPPEGAVSAGR